MADEHLIVVLHQLASRDRPPSGAGASTEWSVTVYVLIAWEL